MLIEAGLIAPFLLALMVTAVETAHYVNLHQKLQRSSTTLSDLVARENEIEDGEIQDFLLAASVVMDPYDMNSNGVAIVSFVNKTANNAPLIVWQEQGGGGLSAASRIGAEGGTASLPSGFSLSDGESVVVTEIFYSYEPIFVTNVYNADTLYERALFRPRIADMVSLSATN